MGKNKWGIPVDEFRAKMRKLAARDERILKSSTSAATPIIPETETPEPDNNIITEDLLCMEEDDPLVVETAVTRGATTLGVTQKAPTSVINLVPMENLCVQNASPGTSTINSAPFLTKDGQKEPLATVLVLTPIGPKTAPGTTAQQDLSNEILTEIRALRKEQGELQTGMAGALLAIRKLEVVAMGLSDKVSRLESVVDRIVERNIVPGEGVGEPILLPLNTAEDITRLLKLIKDPAKAHELKHTFELPASDKERDREKLFRSYFTDAALAQYSLTGKQPGSRKIVDCPIIKILQSKWLTPTFNSVTFTKFVKGQLHKHQDRVRVKKSRKKSNGIVNAGEGEWEEFVYDV